MGDCSCAGRNRPVKSLKGFRVQSWLQSSQIVLLVILGNFPSHHDLDINAGFALSQFLALASTIYGYFDNPEGLHSRQISPGQLSNAYDYIVVGGGQSGLVKPTVSAKIQSVRLGHQYRETVLIVEYGYFDDSPAQLEPSSATQYLAKNLFNATSIAQPGLGNKQGTVYAASVVGGGSTVNGMLFDRGSADDYNNWEKLGNPGWGFSSLLPYFKKSATFTPPRADLAVEYNITWDIPSAWGNGPVQATFPDWQWPTIKTQWSAWTDVGVPINAEGAAGNAFGAYWVPSNTDQNYRRSYARNAYFDPAKNRSNLKLLVGYRVNEVLFTSNKRADSVKIQARGTANGAATITVKAAQEIILFCNAAELVRVPQAGIPVLVDLPGVGSNLQDHPAVGINYQSSLYNNATFQAWAAQQWTLRKGPSSVGVGNALATVPFPILSPPYRTTIDKTNAQNAATYLPKTYGADNIKGFVAQRAVILDSFARNDNGVVEIPFSGGGST
ncbi:hypothetical protein CVT25_000543 [Psilocybe cyanescens]|uniref:Glucose-methanol-choline oxidoreductase N-terminal domain-containing protein n=1 Tax=Psilocybe cyanescens TaxID=93625 RepID=A0A409WZS1_PSICY|nr:hypothetical protein CVT25_000543 [Psilocybe cyanescens]